MSLEERLKAVLSDNGCEFCARPYTAPYQTLLSGSRRRTDQDRRDSKGYWTSICRWRNSDRRATARGFTPRSAAALLSGRLSAETDAILDHRARASRHLGAHQRLTCTLLRRRSSMLWPPRVGWSRTPRKIRRGVFVFQNHSRLGDSVHAKTKRATHTQPAVLRSSNAILYPNLRTVNMYRGALQSSPICLRRLFICSSTVRVCTAPR